MKYIFEINVYTDGDFSLPFVPRGMRYDENYSYSFQESYNDREIAIKSILRICEFLKENMYTSREYVKESWNRCIDNFIEGIKNSDSTSLYERVSEEISGNYDGTEFIFEAQEQYINCGFCVNDEEYALIKQNKINVTNEMIKETVMALFKNNMESQDGK